MQVFPCTQFLMFSISRVRAEGDVSHSRLDFSKASNQDVFSMSTMIWRSLLTVFLEGAFEFAKDFLSFQVLITLDAPQMQWIFFAFVYSVQITFQCYNLILLLKDHARPDSCKSTIDLECTVTAQKGSVSGISNSKRIY